MEEFNFCQEDWYGDSQCLQRGRILSWPPTSHTVNEMFLYSTVSTLNPVFKFNRCQLADTAEPTHQLLGWSSRSHQVWVCKGWSSYQQRPDRPNKINETQMTRRWKWNVPTIKIPARKYKLENHRGQCGPNDTHASPSCQRGRLACGKWQYPWLKKVEKRVDNGKNRDESHSHVTGFKSRLWQTRQHNSYSTSVTRRSSFCLVNYAGPSHYWFTRDTGQQVWIQKSRMKATNEV